MNGRPPVISVERGRVVIMIGNIGLAISVAESQRVRREMIAAEHEATAMERGKR